MADGSRNYEVTGLIPHAGEGFTVEIEVAGVRRDSGERPSAYGEWGLSRAEKAILRRGFTASGKDRVPA